MEQYRLQLFDPAGTCFAINWANVYDRHFKQGDCVVRAIRAETDVDAHNREHLQQQRYTRPMTLDEARAYISARTGALGKLIHDCVGLVLEDAENRLALFVLPITVRS